MTTVTRDGRRSTATVSHVLGAPRAAMPHARAARSDPVLQRRMNRLAAAFGGTSAIYVQNLTTGTGAAWNAKATFPGASSLKLAVAVAALSRADGTPTYGSSLDALLHRMLVYSDNEAANATERYYGGSTSGGSAIVNSMMRSLGLVDTEMYGGYEFDALEPSRGLAGGIPLRVDSQPSWGIGKRTTAFDLGSLLRAVWLASGGRGPLRATQPGFTPADARYLLYLLAHVRDSGKIDRRVGRLPGVEVLHKGGWIDSARHDNGIVLWQGGALLVTVMTYRSYGAGVFVGRACGGTSPRQRSRATAGLKDMTGAGTKAGARQLEAAPSECAASRGSYRSLREATVRGIRAPLTETRRAHQRFVRVP